eukprot:gene5465-5699_t
MADAGFFNTHIENASFNVAAKCDLGTIYRGLLCGSCQERYGQTDAFSCSKCLPLKDDSGNNTPGILGLLAFYTAIFVGAVWGSVSMIILENMSAPTWSSRGGAAFDAGFFRRHQKDAVDNSGGGGLCLTDVVKLLIIYIQNFAGVIVKLPVSWPTNLSTLFANINILWGTVNGSSASLDCLLKALPVTSTGYIAVAGGIDRSVLKGLINLLLPGLTFVLVLMCQVLWWACKRRLVLAVTYLGLRMFSLVSGRDGLALAATSCDTSTESSQEFIGSTTSFIIRFESWCRQRRLYASSRNSWYPDLTGLMRYLRQRFMVTMLVTVFFFYPSLVRVAVGMLSCIEVCGTWYWVLDMEKLCPKSNLKSNESHLVLAVGVLAALLSAVVPLMVVVLLSWAVSTNCLHSPKFQQQFGFLYKDYTVPSHHKLLDPEAGGNLGNRHVVFGAFENCYRLFTAAKERLILMWDVVIHSQTVLLVSISSCGLVLHEYYQTLVLAAAFGVYLLLVLWLRPFSNKSAQRLQALSAASLFATSFLILFFIPPDFMDKPRQQKLQEVAKPAAAVLLLFFNFLFLVYALLHVVWSIWRHLKPASVEIQEAAHCMQPQQHFE